ncbi:hypothetical protein, conserved [Leishmania lindenbergi]|uniref:Uncharacterized protein n=1 Tax=Leishmania lindenbergi TaxID=651832 RepID=A0AAW3AIL4_9TRYP
MFTAAPTEAGGMRTLFQLCLQTPLAAASATLRVSDWHILLDKLRQEGHHKLPPQPILDDVARTITHIMQSEGHPDGLTLSSFACIMQRQLKEVRGDMTSPLSADFATGDGTASRQGAVLHFPQHPKYVLAVPTSAVAAAPQSSLSPLKRRSRRSSQTTLTVASNSGLWRVLPTWCMALAGLFPLEMSSVCPVPVVCYLRSIGLIRAVLEAIMQRLQLELEAIPEYVASFAKAARRETQHRSESAAAESFVPSVPPEGSEGSRSMSNLLALSGASAGARRACSAVVARGAVSASSDGDGRWKEQPVWCPAMSGRHRRRVKYRKRGAAMNTTTIPGGAGGDGAVVVSYPQRVTNGNRRLNADVTISASSGDVKSHYLDQRPLDEISVSVVARAKARRLMDTLRRHTVPINRYECFARVEPESEPVQKPLCFVSQEELKSTFSGGGDEDSHDDSDAMSDMMAALTYNPGEETVVGLGGTATKGGGDVDVDQSRSSPHPPPLSRIPASSVLPTVIMSATRFSVPVRGRASPASASRAASVGSSVILSATSAGAGGAMRPPPRVPSMFRMSGVLPTALPRKQEEALVRRLSKPTCNPVAMSLRAASTENAYTHCHAADTTAIISTSDSASVNAKETEDRSTRLAPSRPPSGAAAQHHYRSHPHLLDHEFSNKTVLRNDRAPLSRNVCHRPRNCPSSAWANPYCTSVGANHQHRPSSSVVSDMGGGGGGGGCCLLQLTEEQSRDFIFFDVPSVLVAAPLSSSAAAAAAVQVMGGGAPVAPLLDAGAPLQPLDPHRRADHSAASRGATRGASKTGAAPPARANAKGESTEGRQAGSTSRNAVAKPARCGSRFRKSSSQCLSDAPQRGQAAADPHGMGCISSRKIIDSGASAHPPLSPHSEPHISLYERRLYRQLQLAHADEHVYHHTNGRKGKRER